MGNATNHVGAKQCNFCGRHRVSGYLCRCHDEIEDYERLVWMASNGEPMTWHEKTRLAIYDTLS